MGDVTLPERIERPRSSYDALGGPSAEQWQRLAEIPEGPPVVLVNLFASRELAVYGDGADGDDAVGVTGQEAFSRYSAVSAPALDAVGGRFVHVGSANSYLFDDAGPWDLVVIGEYPSLEALLALHEGAAYREAYRHRIAACARHSVLVTA